MEKKKEFIPRRPDVRLVIERVGWMQPDGHITFSAETKTYVRKIPEEVKE